MNEENLHVDGKWEAMNWPYLHLQSHAVQGLISRVIPASLIFAPKYCI